MSEHYTRSVQVGDTYSDSNDGDCEVISVTSSDLKLGIWCGSVRNHFTGEVTTGEFDYFGITPQ